MSNVYPASSESKLLRQISELERELEDVRTRPYPRSLGSVIGSLMGLPRLRGFWPMGSANQNDDVSDLSGQARTLTKNGTISLPVYNSVVPYADFGGAATDFFSRADESALDITGVLTMGGWFWSDAIATQMGLMGKFLAAGNQRSYWMQFFGSNLLFSVSVDGTAVVTVTHTTTLLTGTWYFCIARYTPSTELKVWVNDVAITNTTSIPASIFNSTATFNIGAFDGGIVPLNGRSALNFLCASALPDSLLTRLFQESRSFFGV